MAKISYISNNYDQPDHVADQVEKEKNGIGICVKIADHHSNINGIILFCSCKTKTIFDKKYLEEKNITKKIIFNNKTIFSEPLICQNCKKEHVKEHEDFLFVSNINDSERRVVSSRFYFSEKYDKKKLILFSDVTLVNNKAKKIYIKKGIYKNFIYDNRIERIYYRTSSVSKKRSAIRILSFCDLEKAYDILQYFQALNVKNAHLLNCYTIPSDFLYFSDSLTNPVLTNKKYFHQNGYLPIRKFISFLETEINEKDKNDILKLKLEIKKIYLNTIKKINKSDYINEFGFKFGTELYETVKREIKLNTLMLHLIVLNVIKIYPPITTILFSIYNGNIKKFSSICLNSYLKLRTLKKNNPTNPKTILSEIIKKLVYERLENFENGEMFRNGRFRYRIRKILKDEIFITKKLLDIIYDQYYCKTYKGYFRSSKTENDILEIIPFVFYLNIMYNKISQEDFVEIFSNSKYDKSLIYYFFNFLIQRSDRDIYKLINKKVIEHFLKIYPNINEELRRYFFDVLNFILLLGLDMSQLYNCKTKKELIILHDKLYPLIQIKKNEHLENSIKEFANTINDEMCYDTDGTDNYKITILNSVDKYITESTEMHHCIKSYLNSVAKKQYIAFNVKNLNNKNDVATIGFICSYDKKNKKIQFDQLKSINNKKASKELICFVKNFMTKNKIVFSDNCYDISSETDGLNKNIAFAYNGENVYYEEEDLPF